MNHVIDEKMFHHYFDQVRRVVRGWDGARSSLRAVPWGKPVITWYPPIDRLWLNTRPMLEFKRSAQVGSLADGVGDDPMEECLRNVTEFWRCLNPENSLAVVVRRTLSPKGAEWRAEAGWPVQASDPDYTVITDRVKIHWRNQPVRKTHAGALRPLVDLIGPLFDLDPRLSPQAARGAKHSRGPSRSRKKD